MKITLDTNVLYQALYGSAGSSHAILQLIRTGELQLALSVPVFEEYQDVLHRRKTRKELGLSAAEVQTVLDFVAFVGIQTSADFLWRPNLRDEGDNMFIELAQASGSDYLITSNIRDFTVASELKFDSFLVVTPKDFMIAWRKMRNE